MRGKWHGDEIGGRSADRGASGGMVIVWTGQRAHPLLGPYDTFPDCLKAMSDYTASHPHVDVAYVRCEEHPADWKGS